MTEPGNPAVLQVQDLTVSLGAFTLYPVRFDVRPGETVCLLGANGAGKTTLLRCILGLAPADGQALLCGHSTAHRDPAWLRLVGVVPDDADELVPELTAAEHWKLLAGLHSRDVDARRAMLSRADRLAEQLQFRPDPTLLAAGYSHGMRKKTQLVAALMHAPPLLIVDEPRNGLDPAGIAVMERLLAQQCARGGAVLAASHDLRWAERIADRVVVLAGGRVVAVEAPSRLCRPGEDLVQAFFRLTDSAPGASGDEVGDT